MLFRQLNLPRAFLLVFLAQYLVFGLRSAAAAPSVPHVDGCTPSVLTFESVGANDNVALNVASATSTITIPAGALPENKTVYDIDVITDISHTASNALTITLKAPGGTVRRLAGPRMSPIPSGAYQTMWDDQADDYVRDHDFSVADPDGRVTPETPLQALRVNNLGSPNGASAGDWILSVSNGAFPAGTGTLASWALRITYCSPPNLGATANGAVLFAIPPVLPDNGSTFTAQVTVSPPSNGNGEVCEVVIQPRLNHTNFTQVSLYLESPSGTTARVTSGNKIQDAALLTAQWSPFEIPASDIYSPGVTRSAVAPDESFGVFKGEPYAGTWKLHVRDLVADASTGTLEEFKIGLFECGFSPVVDNPSFSLEELTPNSTPVGQVRAQQIFKLGKKDNSGPKDAPAPAEFDGLIFGQDVPFTIRSVTVFPEAASSGNINIGLHPFINASTLPPIATVSKNVPLAGPDGRVALPINLAVPKPAEGLYSLLVGSNAGGTQIGNFARNTGVDFGPFNIPGVARLVVDTGLVAGKYSGFYDWEISAYADNFTFTIVTGNVGGAFSINPLTGVISVANSSLLLESIRSLYTLQVLVTNNRGFSSLGAVTIDVIPRESPVVTCPPDITVANGASTSTSATGTATAFDAQDGTIAPAASDTTISASCPLQQRVVREWKAIDSDGNSHSCTQTISVQDPIPDDRNGNGVFECQAELGTTDINGQCVPGAGDCIYEELKSTACVGANGFLGQVNIASVINLQLTNLGVLVQYIDAGGVVRGQVGTNIAPNLKTDFIINDLGLKPDTIGTVCVTTNAGGPGAWTGGISIYKPDTRNGVPAFGSKFDFALYYPFLNPSSGTTTTPLNTYHLGTSPAALVANWISIIDAVRGDSAGVAGVINVFDASGSVVSVLPVNLPDGGRADFPGHEALAGFQNSDAVGLAQFVPSNTGTYYMTLTRYFYDCPGASCSNFLTAFNIPKRPGSAQAVSGLVSTFDGELAVVELNNVTTADGAAAMEVFAASGGSAGQTTFPVPSRATRHVIVNNTGQTGFLASNEVGSTRVQATNGSLSALSIFYKLSAGGVLQYAYAAPLVESPGVGQLSQFNTYIGHSNRIEVVNTSAVGVSAQASFFDYTGANILNTGIFTLASKETKRLDTKSLPVDSYGTFTVSAGPGVVVRNYVSRAGEYTVPFLGE